MSRQWPALHRTGTITCHVNKYCDREKEWSVKIVVREYRCMCVLFVFLSENNSICGCKIYLLTVHSCKSHGSCNCYHSDCTSYNLFFHIHGSLMRHQSRSNISPGVVFGVYLFSCSWLDVPIVTFTSVDIIRGNVQVLYILRTNKCLVVEGICPPTEIYLSPFLIGRNRPTNSLECTHRWPTWFEEEYCHNTFLKISQLPC